MKSNVTVKDLKEFLKKYEFNSVEVRGQNKITYLSGIDNNTLLSDLPVVDSVFADYKNCVKLFSMKDNCGEIIYVSDKLFAVHNYSDETNNKLNLNYQKYMTKYVEGYADYITDAYTSNIKSFKNEIYKVNGEIKESSDEFYKKVQKQKVRAYEQTLNILERNKKEIEEFVTKNLRKGRQF